jgi:hypothetical protein
VCAPDTGSPVWAQYKPLFRFAGALYSATVDVSGELIKNEEHASKYRGATVDWAAGLE